MTEQQISETEQLAKASDEIGVGVFEGPNFTLRLAIRSDAMTRVHSSFKKEVLYWVVEKMDTGNRMEWAEILHFLQEGTDYSIKEIVDEFFADFDVFISAEFQQRFLDLMSDVTGKKFREIMDQTPQAEGEAGKKS